MEENIILHDKYDDLQQKFNELAKSHDELTELHNILCDSHNDLRKEFDDLKKIVYDSSWKCFRCYRGKKPLTCAHCKRPVCTCENTYPYDALCGTYESKICQECHNGQ